MRIGAFSTRGIGAPFRDREVSLDFASLPDGVIGVIGGNGAGKTHLLELSAFGAFFREFPSYRSPTGKKGESLVDHVHPDTRDAFVDETFTMGGQTYRIRVNCDGKRRKMEAFLWRAGEPEPFAGPLTTDVDAQLAEILPSRALLLAGPVACQGGFEGFFRLGPSDRKGVFVEMLGLGHLEALAAAAAKHEDDALDELSRVRAALVGVAERATRIEAIAADLTALAPQVDAATAALATARSAAAEARAALEAARATSARLEAEAAAATAERHRVVREREAAAARVDGLTERLRGIDAALAEATTVEAAANRLVVLDGELAVARQREEETVAALRPVETTLATEQATLEGMRGEVARLQADHAVAEAAAARVGALAAPLAHLASDASAVLAEAAALLEDAQHALPSAEDAARAEAEAIAARGKLLARRSALEPQTSVLGRIPGVSACEGCIAVATARQAVATIQQLDTELADIPAVDGTPAADRLAALRRDIESLTPRRERARQWAEAASRVAAEVEAERPLAARAPELAAEIDALVVRGRAKRSAVDQLVADQAKLSSDLDTCRATIRRLTTEREQVSAVAVRLTAIATARAERASVGDALREAETTRDRLATTPLPEPVALDVLQAAITAAEETATQAVEAEQQAEADHRAVLDRRARLEGEREGLGDALAERDALQAREAALVVDASDWRVLAQGLGRNGAQALLIDAAGPEVAMIANELLAQSYSGRFQLSLVTTQPTVDGKSVRDVFEPRLLDCESGRDASRASGGETVLIDAALRLAMVIVNARRSGVDLQTLWLDETGAALSQENGPRYVAMIRHAMQLGGFRQALLVSHAETVWEATDVRIVVEDGEARVWIPTENVAA